MRVAFRLLITSACLQLLWMVLIAKGQTDSRANYTFTTCGSRDREGPTYMQCMEHYCNSGSLVCGHLLNESTRGSQIFVVPRSGNYTVTIAGASGGHGVCSNYSGQGVIATSNGSNEVVYFRRGEKLRILVGQQGTSACDGHQDVDICQVSNDTEVCENLWNTTYRDMAFEQIYLYDGGGGGGGASLLERANNLLSNLPIGIAPGGGGAAAIHNITDLSLKIEYDDFDELELFNYTYGYAFDSDNDYISGTIGGRVFVESAGPGAGYNITPVAPVTTDADALMLDGFGGQDCSKSIRFIVIDSESLPFPDTHGGFGGGGGGCNGGGGGGGYTGGSIFADGATIPGEGGYSWPDPPWPLIRYNDGDGYVELFLESCGCTYNCIIDDQSSFECSCPSDAILALNGFDCYTEEDYYLEVEDDPITFLYLSYGEITANIVYLNSTIFSYSIAAAFDSATSFNFCALLFLDNDGNLVATTKFINSSVHDDDFEPLELFTMNRTFNSSVTSFNLSMNSEVILEEPLFIASVITFGIDGGCILEGLMINASIDDIYVSEPDPDQMVNLTSVEILMAYLDSFMSPNAAINSTTNTTDNPITNTGSSDGLSAGAIAGIALSVVVIIIVSIAILAMSIYFCKHFQYKIRTVTQMEDQRKDSMVAVNKYITDSAYHEYERLTHGYENVPNVEMATMERKGNTLKYGFKAPLLDYYTFNCSRQSDDWSYDRSQLTYMREIGEGQFGKVLLMKAKDICGVQGSLLVAVKTLTSRDPKDIQRFSEEMGLMMKFIHPNIVSLLGHCEATSDGAPMMILELMQYGDLKWFLQSNRPSEEEYSVITDSVAINIVTDVATALEYLAANKYVHRDVAARNCLIGEEFKAKLSDFGLARGVHEKDYYKVTGQTTLPVRWMAPESLLYGKFTSASDVWSYGVLVWEVATFGDSPHEGVQVREIIELANNSSLKLNRPVRCPEVLADIISQCTRVKSKDRPTLTEILEYYKSKHNTNTTATNSVEQT